MSEEQAAKPQPAPDGWGQRITEERQVQLAALAEQQRAWVKQPEHERGDSHFKGVKLTGADVFWLAARAVAGPEGDIEATATRLRDEAERYSISVSELHLEGADLGGAHLEGANLGEAQLNDAHLFMTHLEGATLDGAQLQRATLFGAQLTDATLDGAHLEGAFLDGAQLQRASLREAHLEGASLRKAQLQRADLREASFDKASQLNDVQLNDVALDQVIFDNTKLSVVEWSEVHRLGDERQTKMVKTSTQRVEAYHSAARAYRSLSVALRAQGIAVHATRFHYRAELMERYALLAEIGAGLFSRRGVYTVPVLFLRWLGSWLLGTFAGYGDYVARLFVTYATVVCSFAALIFVAGQQPLSLASVRDALVLSVTSFHGRGLQPPGLPLNDAIATLAGAEAVFGLLIEGIFIAAFTRRVTGG